MIKTVFFDLDDTLYSYGDAEAYGMQAAMDYCRHSFGMEEQELHAYYMKAWKLADQRIGTESAAIHSRMIRFQCMMELLNQPLFPHVRTLYHTYWDNMLMHMEPFRGIESFFQRLKEKQLKIGIGTNMTAYIQYRKLEVLGLSEYIDLIVTSEEAGTEKPHPQFFSLCVEKAGCLPQECAFIGDNIKNDVEASIAGGLYGIWYSGSKEPEQDMPFPVIRSYEDCLELPLRL